MKVDFSCKSRASLDAAAGPTECWRVASSLARRGVPARALAGLDEAALICKNDSLNAVAEAELGQDVSDVCLRGVLADDEVARDLMIGSG